MKNYEVTFVSKIEEQPKEEEHPLDDDMKAPEKEKRKRSRKHKRSKRKKKKKRKRKKSKKEALHDDDAVESGAKQLIQQEVHELCPASPVSPRSEQHFNFPTNDEENNGMGSEIDVLDNDDDADVPDKQNGNEEKMNEEEPQESESNVVIQPQVHSVEPMSSDNAESGVEVVVNLEI